ncbi:MAG TPA: hypothetical protein VFR02_07920, partial [bacterium]|nr:hypothetical protein [bacterium]
MRIKRYEAPTIQEALQKVKKDLGPEAVILYTKTFRKGGVMGMFGKPMAEITAGIDLNLMDDMARRKTSASAGVVEGPETVALKPAPAPAAPAGMDPARAKVRALQRELNEMKTSSLAGSLRESGPMDSLSLLSEGFSKLRKKMAKQEVEDFLIQKVIKGMMNEKVDPEKAGDVQEWLHRFVMGSMKIAPPMATSGFP